LLEVGNDEFIAFQPKPGQKAKMQMIGLYYYNARWYALMGFNAGDIYLRANTFYATGVNGVIMEGVRTQWTYIFRGSYQTHGKSETPIYNPHRPY
jgi:hypothetical protein